MELADLFPDEAAATAWFESLVWPEGRFCPHCGNTETNEAPVSKKKPYWCPACRKGFSVKIGTVLEKSKVLLRKWAFAICLELRNHKGVSSMKLHRDVNVTQKTAWFMLHRFREAWAGEAKALFEGPVEVDETYSGGKRKNRSNAKRKALKGTERGAIGKTAVVGAKDRETNRVAVTVVQSTDASTLQGFVECAREAPAKVYTDDAAAYLGMDRSYDSVNHSVGEYVREMAHTNGVESFWSMLKRGYQ